MNWPPDHNGKPACNCCLCCALKVRERLGKDLDVPFCKHHPHVDKPCPCGAA